MKAVYAATFELGDDGVYHVRVPDVSSVITFGSDVADALDSAYDALSLVLVSMEDLKLPIPAPSPIGVIAKPDNGFVSLIAIDTVEYRRMTDNHAVRKNVSLPAWMAAKADKQNLNLSQLLQGRLAEVFDTAN